MTKENSFGGTMNGHMPHCDVYKTIAHNWVTQSHQIETSDDDCNIQTTKYTSIHTEFHHVSKDVMISSEYFSFSHLNAFSFIPYTSLHSDDL